MDFNHKISLAKQFSKRPKLGFRVWPVKLLASDDFTDDTWIKCPEEEAEIYSVYCIIQDNDLIVEEWIADLDTQEAAENLRSLLCNLCGMDNCELLTKERLDSIGGGRIIGSGVFCCAKLHLGLLRWVAVKKHLGNSWVIYYSLKEWNIVEVIEKAEEIESEEIVRSLIPCDKEAWGMYRG